ncbi:MAG: metallophosphoesterase family protein [Pseudomonadota bacterium]
MDETLYAIGDVHGRVDLLDAMIARINSAPSTKPKRLVFLGDYVDRGPASAEVIQRLISLQKEEPKTVLLKGNHEAALLSFLEDPDRHDAWLEWGGVETMESYRVERPLARAPGDLAAELRDRMPDAHLRFLRGLRLSYEAGDYYFVHAGIRPGVALCDQDERDLLWIREAFHNAPASARPEKTIVHGHHPTRKPLDQGWRIGVDTGAVWSGALSAVEIDGPSRRFISVEGPAGP